MSAMSSSQNGAPFAVRNGVHRRTALIIGAGGSGISTARMVRAIALHGQDGALKQMVADRRLIFFGVDADRSENDEREIDIRMLPIGERNSALAREEKVLLPTLDDFIWLDSTGIVSAAETLQQDALRLQDLVQSSGLAVPNFNFTHPLVASWYPFQESPDDPLLPVSKVKEGGAQQLRPLGRLGLFLNSERVYSALKAHLAVAEAQNRGSEGPVEVYIVASLAGGTGSGIFWDLAFMTRRLSRTAEIRGIFLMPSVFSAAQAQNNAELNTFAALTELTNWKNWLYLPSDFHVAYPASDRVDFTAHRGGNPVFDSVHLFGPAGTPVGGTDTATSMIRGATASVAGTILTYLRQDVRRSLRHKAQNGDNDGRAGTSDSARASIFCTATSIEFPYINVVHFEKALADAARQMLEIKLAEHYVPHYSLDAFLADLALLFVQEAAPDLDQGKRQKQVEELAAEWAGDLQRAEGPDLFSLLLKRLQHVEDGRLIPRRAKAVADALDRRAKAERPSSRRLPWLRAGQRFEADCQSVSQDVHREMASQPHMNTVSANPADAFAFKGFIRDLERQPDSSGEGNSRKFAESLEGACCGGFGLRSPRELVAEEVEKALVLLTEGLEILKTKQKTHLLDDRFIAQLDAVKRRLSRAKDNHAALDPDATGLTISPDLAQVDSFVRIATALDPDRPDVRRGATKGLAVRVVGIPPLYTENIIDDYYKVFSQFAATIRRAYSLQGPQGQRFIDHGIVLHAESIIRKISQALDHNRDFQDAMKGLSVVSRDRRQRDLANVGDLGLVPEGERMQRFSRLLRSISDTLNKQQNEDYIASTSKSLAGIQTELADDFLKRWKTSPPTTEQAVAAAGFLNGFSHGVERWRSALKALIDWDRQEDPYGRLIVQRMFQEVRGIGETQIFDVLDAHRNQRAVDMELFHGAADVVMRAFARHWVGDENLLKSRIGGDQGLYEDLLRMRPVVFADGADENRLRTDSLVVILPRVLGSEGRINPKGQDSLRDHLRIITQKALNATAISAAASDVPVVYYEQLYRSPPEIAGIKEMYRNYMSRDVKERRFFHISKDCVGGLLPILRNQALNVPVFCGNVDCARDIRYLDRQVMSCPGCHKPIWNRCGNPKCHADDVMALVDLKRKDRPSSVKITKCPACGDMLETYYWSCPDPAHTSHLIERDKDVCPLCLVEHGAGTRSASRVHSRPDKATLKCPACPDWAGGETAIPADMKEYFLNGVNGFKHFDFARRRKLHDRDAHLCPCDQPERHFSFPTCPEGRFDKSARHHLYRKDGGPFHCPIHIEKSFYVCDHCEYPVEVSPRIGDEAPHLKDKSCPRCLQALRVCHMCSNQHRRAYPVGAVQGNDPERCPNCLYPMDGISVCRAEHVHPGLTEAGICRNSFSCKAGRNPWHYQTELSHSWCDACVGPRAPLLPADRLRELVESCPVCLSLHGLPRHWSIDQSGAESGFDIERLDLEQALGFLLSRVERNGVTKYHFEAIHLGESCPLCGVKRGEMIREMLAHVLAHSDGARPLRMPTVRPTAVKADEPSDDGAPKPVPAAAAGEDSAQSQDARAALQPLVKALNPSAAALKPDMERVMEAIRQFHQTGDVKAIRVNLKGEGIVNVADYQELCKILNRLFDSRLFSGKRLLDRAEDVERVFQSREPSHSNHIAF